MLTESDKLEKKQRLCLFLCLAVFLAVAIIYSSLYFWNSIDDTYITLRYAQNWAAGHGPVYNPGERVEGYTNFGWLALLTPFVALGIPGPVIAKILSVACGLGVIVFGWLLGRRLAGRDSWAGVLIAALLTVDGTLGYWSTAGMEGPALALTLAAAFYIYLGKRETGADLKGLTLSGVLFGLAILLRPDAALFALAAFVFLFQAKENRWKRALAFLWPVILIVVGQLAFRLAFYGEWLPNTFHAKVGLNRRLLARGTEYLGRFFISHAPVFVLLFFVPWRRLGRKLAPVLTGAGLYCIFLVAIGGDWMAHRLFVPLLPLLMVTAALGLTRILEAKFRPLGRATPGLMIFLMLGVSAAASTLRGELFENIFKWRHNEVYHHNVGYWLAEVAHPDDVVAVTPAGTIPYLNGLKTIDMLGLNDAHIAREGTDIAGLGVPGHERFDNDYVLDRAPEWIVLNLLPPQLFKGTTPQLHHEADLLQRLEFWEAYTLISPPVQGNCVFHRRDDAEGLSRLPEESWRETWHFLWPGLRERVRLPEPPESITGEQDIG